MDLPEGYFESNELDSALAKFENMLKNRETCFFDVEEIELVVEHFIFNQNNNRARKAIKIGCEQHPDSLELKIKEAEVLISSGKNTQALDKLLKLEQIDRFNQHIPMLIAGIYSQQKNHHQAISYLQKALTKVEEDEGSDIIFDLALEYESLGQFDTALKILKDELLKWPENDAIAYEILYCYAELDKESEAVSYFSSFLDENPYSFLGWYNLGICYSKIDEYEKAATAFDYCTILDPEVSLPYYQKAFMHLELGEYEKALHTYQDCLESDEPNAIIYTYMGECYEKLNDLDTAKDFYSMAINADDLVADAWLGMGVVLDLEGNTEKALKFLSKAAELNRTPDYLLVYAEALCKLELFEEADAIYKELFESEYRNTSFWLDYAHYHLLISNAATAVSVIDDALNKLKDPALHYRRCAYLFMMGLQKEAEIVLQDCLDSNPDGLIDFLEYYPDAKALALLSEFIDLHKKQ